ncbi:hypothetical protein bthur0014_50410 [Bacillus thuringiensis IBL 4222]|nr:hypothetical protein bthur0014_50410 [Bacillus thuringiensis IBL 4222]
MELMDSHVLINFFFIFADFHIFTPIYSMRYLLLSLQEGMIRFM